MDEELKIYEKVSQPIHYIVVFGEKRYWRRFLSIL